MVSDAGEFSSWVHISLPLVTVTVSVSTVYQSVLVLHVLVIQRVSEQDGYQDEASRSSRISRYVRKNERVELLQTYQRAVK